MYYPGPDTERYSWVQIVVDMPTLDTLYSRYVTSDDG